MAKIDISLQSALALYDVAVKVRNGELDVGPLTGAYLELAEQLDNVLSEVSEWEPGRSNNLCIAGPGWMVSYKIASDSRQPETALIDRDKREFFVLPGDHRDAYKHVASQGFNALKQVYESLKDPLPHDA
ncbi:hypothetical protein WT83_27505 [Burkholderia territorii]|uniref:Uncharacterized protein n=2 Tax=Burkholderia territorii TaxID=1503055 RepID=A0A108E864_9BURK|nr:hypothetical protein WT83_27505 [Burkholderia territorii]